MILNHVSKKSLSLIIGAAFLVLAGCGSEAAPSPDVNAPATSATTEATGSSLQAIGTAVGHFQNGHVSFDSYKPVGDSSTQVKPEGFGTFTQSLITFSTDPGDGVGTGTCTSTQYCAAVALTNNTARVLQSVYVEITDYFGIEPAGTPVSWAGTPFTRSSAYASAFVNSGNIEAADYGDFTSGQTTYREFKFNVGAATNFYFNVTVYATFPRQYISGGFYSNVASVDACNISGNTLLTNADDAEVDIALPFAFTLVDLTYDRAVVGSNGYVLLYQTGNTPPSLSSSNNGADNQTLLQPNFPQGFYPFWDDLAYGTGGGVCMVVTGTTPNRTLSITWSQAQIASNQPGKSTFSAETVTYSLTLTELTDAINFVYNLPAGGITDLTRGGSATIGIYDISRGSDQAQFYGYNSPSVPPSSASSYPFASVGAQYNTNP